MCISKSVIRSNESLQNKPFNVVFSVAFDNEDSGIVAYLDIVYKFTFLQEIIPALAFEKNVLVSDQEENVVIDARNSRFANGDGSGLTYRWQCDGLF